MGRFVTAGVAALAGLTGAMVLAVNPARAAVEVVYDSIGPTLADNVASFAFDANQTAELGDLVELGPGPRYLVGASTVLSSWACETGAFNTNNCVTTPGATFTHPVTMTIYSVSGTPQAPTVGAPLAAVTQTLTIPFRPSQDTQNCAYGQWQDIDGVCQSGIAVEVDFSFAVGATLPDTVIWGVSFNTAQGGYAPIMAPGPYQFLNVGVRGVDPVVGTDVDPGAIFLAQGAPNVPPPGMVRDTGWTPYRPMAKIQTASVPGTAPEPVTAVAGDGQVTLSWTAPTDDGGSPITGYVVGGDGTCTPSPATATSCVVTGLTNGTAVSFTVAAQNAVGVGPTAASSAVTPLGLPAAPSGVTAVPGDGQVTLSWTAPTDDGGSPITGYVVGGVSAQVAGFAAGTCTPSPATATSCVVTGLANGVPVSFTVAAQNAVGVGPVATSPVVTPTAAVAPTTPTTTTTTVDPGDLPATGSSSSPTIVVFAALIVALGGALLWLRRRPSRVG